MLHPPLQEYPLEFLVKAGTIYTFFTPAIRAHRNYLEKRY